MKTIRKLVAFARRRTGLNYALTLASLAVAGSCGQSYKPTEVTVSPTEGFDIIPVTGNSIGTPTVKTDEYFVQKFGKKLDILFVLDNSGSMSQELANVRSSFADFIQIFADKGMDYQVGLISTDARADGPTWSSSAYKNYPSAGLGKLLARPSVLAKTGGKPFLNSKSLAKADMISLFKENTELGLEGSGAETGLLSTIKFLAPAVQSGANAGFMRADSTFVTVVVSDEDESLDPDFAFDSGKFEPYLRDHPAFEGKFGWTGKDPGLFTKDGRIETFISRTAAAKGNRPDRFQFYGMVSNPSASCADVEFEKTTNPAYSATPYYGDPAVPAQKGVKGDGVVYDELAGRLYGDKKGDHIKSVCTNFSQALTSFSSTVANSVERSFDLSNRVESCMKVFLDGTRIPESTTAGWTFIPAKNRVAIAGLDLESKESFTVKIQYVSLTEYPEFKVNRGPAAAATRTKWGCK